MSKYKDCHLFVDGNGKYCCRPKRIFIGENSCAQISLIGTGPVELLMYPSGDTDETPLVHSILEEGLNLITECGIYKLNIDCTQYDGIDAPADVNAQALACCKIVDKNDMSLLTSIMQQLCDKLALGNDSMAVATIVLQLEELCQKMLANNVTQGNVLLAIQALCDKILAGNTAIASVVTELEALCTKLNTTNTNLETLITSLNNGFDKMLLCLEQIKDNQVITNDKLCQILGDPNLPCPTCPGDVVKTCDVSLFMTYAQADFTITGITIPGVDTTGKFTDLPINGNSSPELSAFKDEVKACLEGAGITVTEQQGRDGWTLNYKGPCPTITTTGQGQIVPACENCVEA